MYGTSSLGVCDIIGVGESPGSKIEEWRHKDAPKEFVSL